MFAFYQQILIKIEIEKFGIENLGQGQWVQHSQLCYLKANINLHKSHMQHFCDNTDRFQILNIIWCPVIFVTLTIQVKVTMYNLQLVLFNG